MVKIFDNDITKAFTGGEPVKAIYSQGVKVWPETSGITFVDIIPSEGGCIIECGMDVFHDLDGNTYYMGLYNDGYFGIYQMSPLSGKEEIIWDNPAYPLEFVGFGHYVWNDGVNVYYDRPGSGHKRLDVGNGWVALDMSIEKTGLLDGRFVWEDYNGVLYSDVSGSYHYKYKGQHLWEDYEPNYRGQHWSGCTAKLMNIIVTYSYNTGYSGSRIDINSVLSRTTGDWVVCHFKNVHTNEELIVHPEDVWVGPDGYEYYSDGTAHYKYLGNFKFEPVSFDINFKGRNIWKSNEGHMYLTENYKTYLIDRS